MNFELPFLATLIVVSSSEFCLTALKSPSGQPYRPRRNSGYAYVLLRSHQGYNWVEQFIRKYQSVITPPTTSRLSAT